MKWVRQQKEFAKKLRLNEPVEHCFQEFLLEARRELMRLISVDDDASFAEAEALHNADERLRKLRSGPIKCREDIGLSEALAVCHCIDGRLAAAGRRKGIKTAVKERKAEAKSKKKICRDFMGGHSHLSRQAAYTQLVRQWKRFPDAVDLRPPAFSTFKDYCKGM